MWLIISAVSLESEHIFCTAQGWYSLKKTFTFWSNQFTCLIKVPKMILTHNIAVAIMQSTITVIYSPACWMKIFERFLLGLCYTYMHSYSASIYTYQYTYTIHTSAIASWYWIAIIIYIVCWYCLYIHSSFVQLCLLPKGICEEEKFSHPFEIQPGMSLC